MIPLKMRFFWPGLVVTFLASFVTMTSTMRSNGCDADEDCYLIKHRTKRDSDGLALIAGADESSHASRVCAKGDAICIPSNYSKFDLPNDTLTTVNVGIDIKDIPKIDDKEFSITLNAFFVVRWTDERMIIDQVTSLLFTLISIAVSQNFFVLKNPTYGPEVNYHSFTHPGNNSILALLGKTNKYSDQEYNVNVHFGEEEHNSPEIEGGK